LKSSVKCGERLFISPQPRECPSFPALGFRARRFEKEHLLVHNKCLLCTVEHPQHASSTIKSCDAVRLSMERLFIRTQGFFVAPGFPQHPRFFEQLLDRHLFPVNDSRRWHAHRRRGLKREAWWCRDDWFCFGCRRCGQGIDSLVVLKLFKQDEATLVTTAYLLQATIVVLSNV